MIDRRKDLVEKIAELVSLFIMCVIMIYLRKLVSQQNDRSSHIVLVNQQMLRALMS